MRSDQYGDREADDNDQLEKSAARIFGIAQMLGPQDMLLKDSLLDSIGILQTVTFCEQTFEISIPEEELLPDNFENIRAVAQLVERRLASTAAQR